MKKLFTTIFMVVIGVITSFAQMNTVYITPNNPEWGEVEIVKHPQGAIQGVFSVSATKKVVFSQGNLQYQASTDTWRFAEHQYDYIGEDNENISSTYNGWIDLFGSGTGDNPTNASGYYTDYSTFVDWGENEISNGDNSDNVWFTLSDDEWDYLLYDRPNARAKQGVAMVNGVNGLVLLPDDWTLPNGAHFTSGFASNNGFEEYKTVNTYTISEWGVMESAGAVFLPAAGYRNGTSMSSVGTDGYYWSSSYGGNNVAFYVFFYSDELNSTGYTYRNYGYSVRLCSEYLSNRVYDAVNLNPLSNHVYGDVNLDPYFENDPDYTFMHDGWHQINDWFLIYAGNWGSADMQWDLNVWENAETGAVAYEELTTCAANGYLEGIQFQVIAPAKLCGLTKGNWYQIEMVFATEVAGGALRNWSGLNQTIPTAEEYYTYSEVKQCVDDGIYQSVTEGQVLGVSMAFDAIGLIPTRGAKFEILGMNVYASTEEGERGALVFTTINATEGQPVLNTVVTLPGVFSVSDTKQVKFSQGNLQYQASTDTWRFAENQYDMVGMGYGLADEDSWCYVGGTIPNSDNREISSTYSGWIDLFGWGTGDNPTNVSRKYTDYSTFVDWGVNKISNGGNVSNAWFTLSYDEWKYLLDDRPNASAKQGVAMVNGVNGLVLLPDDWTLPNGAHFTSGCANDRGSQYYQTVNTYTISEWQIMESAGAVFLPAAGYRGGTSVYAVGTYGFYWSRTWHLNSYSASYVYFDSGNLYSSYYYSRSNGRSVRLCVDVENSKPVVFGTFSISSNISSNGATITGVVNAEKGANITERGVCYATSTNPTVTDNKVVNGSGVGSYTCSVTGLQPNTTYYVRPYVINSKGTYYGEQISYTTERYEGGKLPGVFSVSDTKQVKFSQGNLQYQASTDTWRFAEHQYDMVGMGYGQIDKNMACYVAGNVQNSDNREISSTYTGWIDLFGWGTGKNPINTSTDDEDYPTFVDWGVNKISNGGNVSNAWFTLSYDEWYYLLRDRTNAEEKQGVACVNGINGLVLLPDNWTLPSGVHFTSGFASNDGYEYYKYYKTVNTYTASEWTLMEEAGAVFLPAAGERYGTSMGGVGPYGNYWSSSYYSSYYAYDVLFYSLELDPSYSNHRYDGYSVRLCSEVVNNNRVVFGTFSISNISSNGATITGVVNADGGANITERGVCYATSRNPTVTDNKVVNGSGVGSYTCSVTGLQPNTTYYVRPYVINSKGTYYGNQISFTTDTEEQVVVNEGAIQGVFSVSATKKVVFSQGNLQYQASTNTWRFAEHQYDYIGEDNENISNTYSGWIDLFGWGTGNNPTNSSVEDDDYSTFVDWGVNKISNGGNVANAWFTLSYFEWNYLLIKRTNAVEKRGVACVNGINGLVLLPDNWTLPSGAHFISGFANDEGFEYYKTVNIYTISEWQVMESAGAVFLPAAGCRGGASMYYVGSGGRYWSNTCSSCGYAYYVRFNSGYLDPSYNDGRYDGRSVRLCSEISSK